MAGSAALVQGLLANDLFGDDGRKVPLTLSDTRTIGGGVQLVTYTRG